MSQPSRGSGFTLIEVLVTIALLGVIMAFAVAGYSSWARASEQSGTARELQSFLRQTQQRAVTEGRSMCVSFSTTNSQYTLYRGACDDPTKVTVGGPFKTNGARVQFTSVAFADTPTNGVTFYARGTATQG